ncbi:MAG TPA: DUF4956 domain-containing protein [Oscillospiraceae bacterium]|nr:DUF4956 domain-containing protein [Oscillospiraceae bacterium]HPS75110.1 DUF4956 domain-containing protein [Oscillospiraceae bacterium]
MLDSVIASGISIGGFLICIFSAIVLGVLTALVFTYKTKHTASLALSLAILPAAVALVIMLVNGNIGAGVAVAGAFALVRFRSVPGTAKEIAGIFISMAIGLACGMGYVGLAAIFFAIMAVFVLVLSTVGFGENRSRAKQLKVTIPENLDYDGLFDDLFEKYLSFNELERIKTSNMGTLYELTYDITLKNDGDSKAFLDELRCRNGNLNIALGRAADKEIAM